eukprot:1155555-Pelagomonas_calceolata.AAC.2
MSEDSKTNDAGEGGPRGGLTTWIVGWEAPQPEAFKMQCSNLWKMVAGMLHWVDMTLSIEGKRKGNGWKGTLGRTAQDFLHKGRRIYQRSRTCKKICQHARQCNKGKRVLSRPLLAQ